MPRLPGHTPDCDDNQDYLAKMHTDLDFVAKALGKDAPSFGRGKRQASGAYPPSLRRAKLGRI